MKELSKEEIVSQLIDLVFDTPISLVYIVAKNPEYDIESYSQEIEDQYKVTFACENSDGLLYWRDYDEFDHLYEEPKEHKEWRLNHNKKYELVKLSVCVTPKRIGKNIYKLNEESITNIVDNLAKYIVYSVSNNLDL